MLGRYHRTLRDPAKCEYSALGRPCTGVLAEEESMAAKKMFPPRTVENVLGDDYDEFKLRIGFRIQA